MNCFDGHFHIIDDQYPLVINQGYLPANFTVTDYLQQLGGEEFNDLIHLIGGAVVSGSFQLFDQTYLINALKQLGTNYVGVTQVPYEISNEEILHLAEYPIKAIRFNINRGITMAGEEDPLSKELAAIESLAIRVFHLAGWHSEFYIDSKLLMVSPTERGEPSKYYTLFMKLSSMNIPVVIDHLGMSHHSFPALLSLYQSASNVWIKLTGFGRISFTSDQVLGSIGELALIDSNRFFFGSDLPSTRAKRAFHRSDLELLRNHFSRSLLEKVFSKNAARLYHCKEKTSS